MAVDISVSEWQTSSVSEDIRIRPYAPGDYPACLALWQSGGQNPFQASQVERLLLTGGGGLIAEVRRENGEAEVVGVLLWSHNGRMATLWRLAVAVPYRGQGIATTLLHQAEHDIQAAGFEGMGLLTRASNHAAKSLYAGQGWHRDEEMEFWRKKFSPSDTSSC